VNAFRLKKQLWRRWRRWKKALWVGASCAALTVLALGGMRVPETFSGLLSQSDLSVTGAYNSLRTFGLNGDRSGNEAVAAVWNEGEYGNEEAPLAVPHEELMKQIDQSGLSRTVHLKTVYVTGEEIQTLSGPRNPDQLKQIMLKHPAWNGWISSSGDLWLEKKVDDLSPASKKDSYIGVDEQGNLTLFKGPPEQEEVMKTFFQMDMRSMKSSLPENIWKQLQDGIRIQDIEEYNSVLSTFCDYARDTAEQVMQSKE
jgi:forespore regulator of the sigma-K checkpoint